MTQWETFTRLVKEGREPADIARTFGLHDLTVKRVLALGNLLPRTPSSVRRCGQCGASRMVTRLQQRELRQLAGQFSKELGLPYAQLSPYEHHIEGMMKAKVQVGDTKFALIERSHEFTLVPWRPVLEHAIGKRVSGMMRESGMDWEIGRSRGLGIGM